MSIRQVFDPVYIKHSLLSLDPIDARSGVEYIFSSHFDIDTNPEVSNLAAIMPCHPGARPPDKLAQVRPDEKLTALSKVRLPHVFHPWLTPTFYRFEISIGPRCSSSVQVIMTLASCTLIICTRDTPWSLCFTRGRRKLCVHCELEPTWPAESRLTSGK